MQKIIVARVSSAHGIKGEVKLVCFLEEPKRIEKYSLFDKEGNAVKIKITNKNKTVVGTTAAGDSILIARVDDINDRNAAELIRDKEIYANRADFSSTKKDEFYISDLLGLDVIDMNSKKIGKVIDVANYGAGTIVEIEFLQADTKNNCERIENFPFKKDIFPEVDVAQGFMRLDLPELHLMSKAEKLVDPNSL